MTIDDIARPPGHAVDLVRGVLHDMIDEVLDRILEAAGDAPDLGVDDRPDDDRPDDDRLDDELPDDELPDDELPDDELPDDELLDDEWPDDEDGEPPGARLSVEEIADTGTQLRASLGAALDRGTRFWGCDGTLRCTRAWAQRFGVPPDRMADNFRRSGRHCDCAVMRGVLGRTDLPRCPLRAPGPDQRGPATS